MNAIVKLQVNDRKLVSGLSKAFSSRHTYLAELMQNGRRAGATELSVSYHAIQAPDGNWVGTLVFADNGAGVTDWQNLLSVADSGWEEAIQVKEQPFGIGFFSCVSIANQVRVESGRQVLEFTREAALAFQDLEVRTNDQEVQGTRITLTGVSSSEHELASALERFAKGFPIRVVLNGNALERLESVDALQANAASYETVTELPGIGLAAISRNETIGGRVRAYLLGICVEEGGHYPAAILHLDPAAFPARLPDRDKLIDHQEKVGQLVKAVGGWWVSQFPRLKATYSPTELWKLYPKAAEKMLALGFLNDVDSLPAHLFERVGEVCFYEPELRSPDFSKKTVTRKEVEAGELVLCTDLPNNQDDGGTIAQTIAHHLEWVCLKGQFHHEHWATKHAVSLTRAKAARAGEAADEGEVQFESLGADRIFIGAGDFEVHVTEEMTLKWNGQSVTLKEGAVVSFSDSGSTGTLVIAGPYDPWAVTAMLDSFTDEWGIPDEEYFNRQRFELEQMIDSLRKTSPAKSLEGYLSGTTYADLANTQNTSVLVVNTQDAGLSVVDVQELQDAVQMFRLGNLKASDLSRVMTPLLSRLAEEATKMEQKRLGRLVDVVVHSHAAHERLRQADMGSYEVSKTLRERFEQRLLPAQDWDVLRTEIENAVEGVVDEVLAQPATE